MRRFDPDPRLHNFSTFLQDERLRRKGRSPSFVPNRRDWARIAVKGGQKADGEKWGLGHIVSGGTCKK
jgi:hypothetical protein